MPHRLAHKPFEVPSSQGTQIRVRLTETHQRRASFRLCNCCLHLFQVLFQVCKALNHCITKPFYRVGARSLKASHSPLQTSPSWFWMAKKQLKRNHHQGPVQHNTASSFVSPGQCVGEHGQNTIPSRRGFREPLALLSWGSAATIGPLHVVAPGSLTGPACVAHSGMWH